MRTPIVRSRLAPLLAFALAAVVLSPTAGCGKERKVRECVSECERAKVDCAHRKDRECAEHEKKCREDCERL